ncbi:hypothetical protein SAMN05421771_2384 [Granulicella pectinivorans]|uniref:TonB-dependent transporter Oar-like beta-barrel domain-containing protein n=1 Tax=Granulicella pectinivorans TaxID=474950 RepID=A0A1I6MDG7_9BACT|nr:hypothetical protein [Granulicella pectinivorans]SFS13744.1 hypothetical protein SAMN05421771_2384 [Granulicella pectinivorans]
MNTVDPNTCKPVILDPASHRIFSVRDNTGVHLPTVHLDPGVRQARGFQKALSQRYRLETLQLAELPSTEGAIRYSVHEQLKPSSEPGLDHLFLPLAEIGSDELPAPQRSAITALLHGETQDLGRFARLGWIEELRSRLGAKELHDIRQVNCGIDFCLLSMRYEAERVWFKAVGEPNTREFALTLTLSRKFRDYLPSILMAIPEWNGWIAEDVDGIPLNQTSDPAAWEVAFTALATMQDEWQLSRSFTLSPGLRWEVSPPPHGAGTENAYTLAGSIALPATLSLAPRGTPLWHTELFNFAPRLGAVWAVDNMPGQELLIRAGAGVFFGTANRPAAEAFNALGFSATNHQTNVPVPVTPTQLNISTAVSAPYTNTTVFAFPQHLQLPYTIQWNVAMEKSVGIGQTLSLSWLGTDSRRLLQKRRTDVRNENPEFGEVNYFPGQLSSSYQALQIRFQRSLSHGLQILGSYGWAHAIDYGSTNPAFAFTRANSDLDVRHNLQAAFTWDEPLHMFGRSMKNFARGWGIDGRLTARTSFPVTPLGNIFSDPATGDRYYSGVDLIPGKPRYLRGPFLPGGRMFNGGPTVDDPAFALPNGDQAGNAPRNTLRGFGAYQFNVAVRKELSIRGQTSLEIRLDIFNVFNHPNFGYLDPGLTDAQFGQPTRMLNQSFGATGSLYEPGGPRSIQLSLRLHF